jgi:hypothetical protein
MIEYRGKSLWGLDLFVNTGISSFYFTSLGDPALARAKTKYFADLWINAT